MSKKRRREQPAVDVQLVELFEDLANVDEVIRVKAAGNLVRRIASDTDASAEQLNEYIRRLIRGLCSGRKAARLGFSIALTESLTKIFESKANDVPGLTSIAELIETLRSQTRCNGNVSGQEERDHHFGRLFGLDSIIKSGVLFKIGETSEEWPQVLDLLLELAKDKPWLREKCGFVLFSAIQSFKGQHVVYAQQIVEKFQSYKLSKTPEGVAIWIAVHDKFDLKFPPNIWHRDSPLNRKEILKLAMVLNEADITDPAQYEKDSEDPKKGSWNTELHFAWGVVLSKLLNTKSIRRHKSSKPSKSLGLPEFWSECIENKLFTKSSSNERKYWGFLLFQRVIEKCPVDLLPSLFTQNFMRTLINHLSSQERFLNVAARKATKVMLARALTSAGAAKYILKALMTGPLGDMNFDKITKTKTIETILLDTDKSSLVQILNVFEELIWYPGTQDDKEAALQRQIAADHLSSLIRNSKREITGDKESLDSVDTMLSIFAKCAYFDMETSLQHSASKPNPPISQASREMFKIRISACMAHMVAKAASPASSAHKFVSKIHEWEQDHSAGNPVLEADTTVRVVTDSAWAILQDIIVESNSGALDAPAAKYLESIQLLYSMVLLQVYNADVEAVSILEELNVVFEGLLISNTFEKASAALVEVLLSLASKSSKLFRLLTQQVFSACASSVDYNGLQSMIKILDTKENLSGLAEIFDQDNEMDDNSEASDVEAIDPPEGTATISSDEDGSTIDDSDSTLDDADDSEGPNGELAIFDAKLAQALGTRPGNADLDAKDSTSSDEDMNDDEMEAVDVHLERVFHEREKVTSKRVEKKDAKETIVKFKCRVLELLEIYVKQEHGSIPTLSLLLPVLTVTRTTTSPLVSSKACNLMREYSRTCKGNGIPPIEDVNSIVNLLEDVHREAGKEGSNAHATACSQASLLLVRVLLAHDRENLRRISSIYAETLGKVPWDATYKVKNSFFTDWLNWCAQAR